MALTQARWEKLMEVIMYCVNCGRKVRSSAGCCTTCGAPIGGDVAVMTSYRSYDAYPARVSQPNALSAAWQDITEVAGWWKKVLFLCFISCIPVLNFAVDGFALRWGRDLSFKKSAPLPKAVFKKKEILTGFRAFLLKVVYDVVFIAASIIVSTIVVGLFASLNSRLGIAVNAVLTVLIVVAYVFAYWPLVNASVMRMTVVDYLESGFNIQKVWKAFREAPGGAIGATLIPSCASAMIQVALWLLFFVIIGAAFQSAAYSYLDLLGGYAYGNSYGNPAYLIDEAFQSAFDFGNFAIAIMVVFFIIGEMVHMFAKMLTWRAVGHWAAQTASEWALESDEEDAANWVGTRNRASDREDVSRNASASFTPLNTRADRNDWVRCQPTSAVSTHDSRTERGLASVINATEARDLDDETSVSEKRQTYEVMLVRASNGMVYKTSSLPAVVGKGSAADVVVEKARSVSREHAKLACENGILTVEDLNSTNGTKVNGKSIAAGAPVAIDDGDVVSLSDEDFKVVIL